ncbi:MAG: sulfotransferase family 2 domain-containing protein [Paracoccaceae bacterium]
MIVSRARGYVFVHIPKTGGTAMALALEARAAASDVMVGDTPKARRRKGRLRGVIPAGRLWKHSTLAEAEGLLSREEMAALHVVTLTRNPWDRAVSLWSWARVQGFDHPMVARAKALEFRAFVTHPATLSALRAAPVASYTTVGGTDHVDTVIRLERFAQDAAPFEAHLGFPLALPRANESARARDWRPFYDAASAEALGRACARDVARFGYGFEPG